MVVPKVWGKGFSTRLSKFTSPFRWILYTFWRFCRTFVVFWLFLQTPHVDTFVSGGEPAQAMATVFSMEGSVCDFSLAISFPTFWNWIYEMCLGVGLLTSTKFNSLATFKISSYGQEAVSYLHGYGWKHVGNLLGRSPWCQCWGDTGRIRHKNTVEFSRHLILTGLISLILGKTFTNSQPTVRDKKSS